MTTEERPTGLAALGALGRVARALVGTGSLNQLAERALDEMRDGLGLELVVLYLPRFAEAATLQRYITSAGEGASMRARDEDRVRRRGLAARDDERRAARLPRGGELARR